MKWTTVPHARDTSATEHGHTIEDWAEFLSKEYGNEKDGLAYCGAIFDPPERKRSNITEVWSLMYDIDGAPDDWRLDIPFQAFAWSTWSHGTDKGRCFRVIVPLAAWIGADEYDAAWAWFNDTYLGGVADQAAKDASRLCYLRRARNPASPKRPQSRLIDGPLLTREPIEEAIATGKREAERRIKRAEARRLERQTMTTDEQFGWVESAMAAIPCNLTPYEDYTKIGLALAGGALEGYSDAYSTWIDWCATASGDQAYRDKQAANRWRTFNGSTLTLGTVWHFAEQNGWTPPKAEHVPIDTDAILDRWSAAQEQGRASASEVAQAVQDVEATTPGPLQAGNDVYLSTYALRALGAFRGELAWTGSDWWHYNEVRGVFEKQHRIVYRYAVDRFHGATVIGHGDKEDKPLTTTHASRMRIEDTARTLQVMPGEGFFDQPRAGLAFRNGFLCAHSGALEPHAPGNRLTAYIPIDYNPGAECPTWDQNMRELFGEDTQTIELLEEFFGACMLGQAAKFAKTLFLLGDGRNGKSTLLGVVQSIMPPDTCCSVSPHKLSANNSEYWILQLRGKLLNTVPDLAKRDLMDMGDFKAIVAGDRVTGRYPHGRPEEFSPVAGHVVLTNELPYVSDTSHGFWNRIIPITFDRVFSEEDRDLDRGAKLMSERPGIVNKLVQAGRRALERGRYTQTTRSAETAMAWRDESTPAKLFFAEAFEDIERKLNPHGRIKASAIYAIYKTWCADTGRKAMNATNFGKATKALGCKCSTISGSRWYWVREYYQAAMPDLLEDVEDVPF